MGFAAAVGASGCGPGPTRGAVDLQTQALQARPGLISLGIYACRRIGGAGSAWSLHAEGRAIDLGIGSGGYALGDLVLGDLRGLADNVLQRVIWDRRTFDLVSPWGRPYTGRDPHTGHLHVELSWPAARGDLMIEYPQLLEEEEETMPILLVAYHGAMWAVSPDLTSRVGLAQSVDVEQLAKINGGRTYLSADLSDGLMARIPEVSAL